MAFKMKGSPIKLGKIQGTAGHASALKQVEISPLKHKGDQKHWHGEGYLPESYRGQNPRAEFRKWKAENNPSPEEQMQWKNKWKESANDPTMLSQNQMKNTVLPKWAQEKYGLPEGANLYDSYNTLVPGSGYSNATRVISMDTGEGAAITGTSTFDERPEEVQTRDADKLANIRRGETEGLELTPEEQEKIAKRKWKTIDEETKKDMEEFDPNEFMPLEIQKKEEERKGEIDFTEEEMGELYGLPETEEELDAMTEIPEEEFHESRRTKKLIRGEKFKGKHGYNPFKPGNQEQHKKHLIGKFGRKVGKKKFKAFKEDNPRLFA